jgi:hypothetical protein
LGTGILPTKDTMFSASSGGGTGGVNGGSTLGAGRSGAQSASQSRSSPSAREHPVPPQEPRHVGALAGTCPQGLARQRGEDLRLDTAPVLRPEGAVDSLVEQASWVDPPRLEHSARRARRPERSDGENTGSYPQRETPEFARRPSDRLACRPTIAPAGQRSRSAVAGGWAARPHQGSTLRRVRSNSRRCSVLCRVTPSASSAALSAAMMSSAERGSSGHVLWPSSARWTV